MDFLVFNEALLIRMVCTGLVVIGVSWAVGAFGPIVGGALAGLKRAEADKSNLVAGLQGLGDAVQNSGDSLLGVLLGQFSLSGNFRDQINFGHCNKPPK